MGMDSGDGDIYRRAVALTGVEFVRAGNPHRIQPPAPTQEKEEEGRMIPKRFKQHTENNRGGWSNWVYPNPTKNYFFKCCDCGLVHEMQFKAFAEVERKRGAFRVVPLPWPIRAMFRARRARP